MRKSIFIDLNFIRGGFETIEEKRCEGCCMKEDGKFEEESSFNCTMIRVLIMEGRDNGNIGRRIHFCELHGGGSGKSNIFR